MAGTQAIIGTKLHPPCAREHLVPRPRLLELLDAGLRPGCHLILISAPAGYGKTTLVASWLSGLDNAQAWISLEETENEPARFLAYLAAALVNAAPEFGSYVGSLLASPQLPTAEIVAIELLNAIIPSPSPFFLVLDDYHALTNPYAHDLIRILLQHLPPHFRLLLVTRADPPFPLNRMRVRGEMTEVRMEDLCFTVDEAKEFLKAMGLALRNEAVASCTKRTEGWAAGLQLAALSLQGRNPEETESFLAAFSGSHRYIIDYLADEVLSLQDPGIREFLRRTAVLDRFTPSLCDEVTDRDDSREMLRKIETNNLFLIPLDGEREWFRYHHLFADSMRTEMGKAERAKVHRQAAKWFEGRGDLPEAVKQALAAGEMTEAVRLIRAALPEMFLQSERELATLRSWLESLPDKILLASSDLIAVKAWVQYLAGRPQEAVAFLAGIPAAQRAEMSAYNQGRLLSLEAHIAGHQGDNARAAGLAREALGSFNGKTDPVLRASTLNTLGQSLARLGDMNGAETAFHQACKLTETFPRAFISVVTVACLSRLLELRGRRREAETICRRNYQSLLDGMGRPSAFGGILAVRLGVIAYEADELLEARLLLETGLELRRAISYLDDMQGEEKLALTLDALGEYAAAMETLQAGGRLHASEDDLFTSTVVEAELRRRHGETTAAMRWAEEWRLSPNDSPNMRREPGYLTYLRLLLDMGRPEQASALVERMAAKAEAEGRLNRLIPFRVLQALTLEALGQREKAVAALRRAATLAASEGYVRAFLDQGPAVAPLLPMVRDTAPGFVDRLAAAFNVSKAGPAKSHPQLVEPLTERELELLKLLAEGLSNVEISHRLYISLNTTKWHLKSIFGKLAVGNRIQAVGRAKELGLI
ncbi:MAG: HTH-type transcriptional regulator MalT [Pelotomaculum sp. PtaB.Bin104]|nr:MAG: HTH-type transcriptional regulator MalT [Pelotomaculum sp. PtaB.Bin104]